MKKIWIVCACIVITILYAGFYIKNKVSISVIIPVYNAEKYLAECLDSVFSQTGSFEVIAVNDGSTDKSAEILQQYAKKYPNLKIITQENKGIAAARNQGIKHAQNKYITFLDNDDWLEPETFSRAIKQIKKDKPDILLTSYYDVYDREWVRQTHGEEAAKQTPVLSRFPNHTLDKLVLFSPFYAKEAYSDLFYETGGIRARFFRKSFIDKYNVVFGDGIGEDFPFLFKAYLNNPLISVLNNPVYNYRNRVDSVSKSVNFLSGSGETLTKFQQTAEYRNADKRTQMLINDSWLALVLIGLANLQRNGVPYEYGLNMAYERYKTFSIYNSMELKSCRNFQRLKKILAVNGASLPL